LSAFFCDQLSDAAHNLLVTINDMLDMSKIEQGKMELYEEPP
jgi:signal transduction histidine kinase